MALPAPRPSPWGSSFLGPLHFGEYQPHWTASHRGARLFIFTGINKILHSSITDYLNRILQVGKLRSGEEGDKACVRSPGNWRQSSRSTRVPSSQVLSPTPGSDRAEATRVGLQPSVGAGYSVILNLLSRKVKGTRPPAKTVKRGRWGPQGSLEARVCSPSA